MVERLDTRGRLAEWFARAGPCRKIDDELVARVRAPREAMYEVLGAVMAGSTPAAEAVDTINACGSAPVPPPSLVPTPSGIDVVWPPDGGLAKDAALAVLARDLMGHLGDRGWSAMLRACACGMIPGHLPGWPRRWCSMEHCGNRAKAARHRARHHSG